jgi:cell division septal protein FtsQ
MFPSMPAEARRRVLGKRQRARRWLIRLRFLGKCCLAGLLCLGIAWVGYVAYTTVCNADYFRLHVVNIAGNRTLSEPEIRYLLALTPETTLLQLDLARMGARLERHPYVKAVALQRVFPDTLNVTITEREPFLGVFASGQGVIVDTEGVALRPFMPEQDASVPRLLLQDTHVLEPGMHLQQPEVQRALEIVHTYNTLPMAGSMRLVSLTVEFSGASVWEVAPYAFKLRVGEGDIGPQLEQLPLVLRYIAQQGLPVKSLDVSYRKRVIAIRSAS